MNWAKWSWWQRAPRVYQVNGLQEKGNETMETKPGYKTTEFWLSTVATVIGFLLASGLLEGQEADSWVMKVVGGVVAVLTALGYNASRAKVKSGS